MASSSTSWFVKGWPEADRKAIRQLLGRPVELLAPAFYERPTLAVTRDLLGKILLVRTRPSEPIGSPRAGVTAARIVEVEGYHGDDPAAHCSRGKTPRCAPMFDPPGIAYVYFIYGMYDMLNFVTERKDYPGAVLIRAVEPLAGESQIARRRGASSKPTDWTNGPGKLTRAMGITLKHNEEPLQGPSLYVLDDGFQPESVLASPRIGIQQGADLPWRYFIGGNRFVSRSPFNQSALPLKGAGA